MSFIVKIILFINASTQGCYLLKTMFLCLISFVLMRESSNDESDENNMWFGYDIQNTCGFHLGFHWVSKLMHVTNLAIFYWLSKV